MNFLETLYHNLEKEPEPDTPEYRENQNIRRNLLKRIQESMGEEMVGKVTDAYAEHGEMECYRYFLNGLRLGLELLGL